MSIRNLRGWKTGEGRGIEYFEARVTDPDERDTPPTL